MTGPVHDDDELARAYAQAQALAGDERGPAATVRANVLAAARAAAAAATPLVPVAAPVAAVDRGRGAAVNRSAWRWRSGLAVAAALVVAIGAWRLEGVREPAPTVVAMAERPAADVPPAPQERAAPAPSREDAAVVAQAERPAPPRRAVPGPRIAKAAPPVAAPPAAEVAEARVEASSSLAAEPPPPTAPAMVAAAPVARAKALSRQQVTTTSVAPAAPQPATLQSAADRGDLDALRARLAGPGAQVDAPDAAGRTALLHAVVAQRAEAVRLLLAAGADPLHADAAGLTPRAAAQAGASAEIAGLLGAPR